MSGKPAPACLQQGICSRCLRSALVLEQAGAGSPSTAPARPAGAAGPFPRAASSCSVFQTCGSSPDIPGPKELCVSSALPASPQGTPGASVKPWELRRPSQCRTPSSGGSRAQPGLVPQNSARRDPSPALESQFHPQSHGDHVLKGNKCPNWTMPEGTCSLVAWGRAQLDFAL